MLTELTIEDFSVVSPLFSDIGYLVHGNVTFGSEFVDAFWELEENCF